MAAMIQNVALVTKINSRAAEQVANKIAKILIENNVNVYCLVPLKCENGSIISPDDMSKINLDLIIAIGGDGTTLRAFRIASNDTPLFSMNAGGNRGILSEVDINSVDEAIEAIFSGNYYIDVRTRIQGCIADKVLPPALNDIFITRVNLTRTPLLSLKLMGDELRQRMDGLVVSTPTGSTGHCFSMGGPVLHEGMNCLILSPIASLNRMPQLVIPVEQIEIMSTHDAFLVIDGQETFEVAAGTLIRVWKYPVDARFLRIRKKGMRQLVKLGF